MKKKIIWLCAGLGVVLIAITVFIGVKKIQKEQFLANFEILTREEVVALIGDQVFEYKYRNVDLDSGLNYISVSRKIEVYHPKAGHIVLVISSNDLNEKVIFGYNYKDAEIIYQEIYENGKFLKYGVQMGIELDEDRVPTDLFE